MTQAQTGATFRKLGEISLGRLLHSAAVSACTLSALAGGVMSSAGIAKAFTIDFNAGTLTNAAYGPQWNPPTNPAPPIQQPYAPGPLPGLLANPGPTAPNPAITGPLTRQWYDTNFQYNGINYLFPTDKRIWFVDQNPTAVSPTGLGGPSNGIGTIEWTWNDTSLNGDWRIPPDPHSLDTWEVDVDFNPPYGPTGVSSVFDYVIQIEDRSGAYPGVVPAPNIGNQYFEDVSLGSLVSGPSTVVKKEIFTTDWNGVDYVPGTLIDTLISNGGTVDISIDLTPLRLNRLYIRDTATPNSHGIDAYKNIYRQTPGPLPILGAGAAFGFSRKLRSRIKAARNA